jgi:hypothetical protein
MNSQSQSSSPSTEDASFQPASRAPNKNKISNKTVSTNKEVDDSQLKDKFDLLFDTG